MFSFRSERGIGRGEVAESRLETPTFAAFLLLSSVVLFAQHLYFNNIAVTVALTISLMVFGITVVRVDFGLYILTIAMLLSPEIDAGDQYTGDVRLNLRYDDVLIMVIFLGVMVKLTFEGRLKLWQPSPINYGILAYYGVCIISTLLALERALGAWDRRTAFFVMLKMLQYYLVFWLTGHVIRTRKDMRNLLIVFYAVAMVVVIYAALSVGTLTRVSAPFEQGGTEPNTLGGYLVVCICVALGLYTQASAIRHRLLFLAIVAACTYPLLFTLSRASYMAVVVGVGIVALISRTWHLGLVLLAVLLASPLVMPSEVIERVVYTFDPSHGEQVVIAGAEVPVTVDKSTYERIYVWNKVWFILTLEPIFTLFGGGVSWESVLDSQYARVLLETGVMGGLAFVFLQLTILRSTRQAYRWTDDWVGRGLAMGMFAVCLSLNVHSTGTISFLIVRIMQPFWLLLALTVFVRNEAIAMHEENARALAEGRQPSSRSSEASRITPRPRAVIRPAVSGRKPRTAR